MATKSAEPTTTYAEAADQMLPNWMYQMPGLALIVVGFGGFGLLTFF